MTDAERFEKAMQAILSVPPERAKEINRLTEADYAAAAIDRELSRNSPGKRIRDTSPPKE